MSLLQTSLVVSCGPKSAFIFLMVLVSSVVSQQVVWTQGTPARKPAQFVPLPIAQRNWQGAPQTVRQSLVPGQTFSTMSTSSLSGVPPIGGKLRLLSTLFGGLRNSGLERTIAGEIIQRLIKTSLKDVLVPFKKDILSPFLS